MIIKEVTYYQHDISYQLASKKKVLFFFLELVGNFRTYSTRSVENLGQIVWKSWERAKIDKGRSEQL